MRSLWSGVISFGLVNIPVRLFSGTVESGLDFDFLHKKDFSRIRYARICKLEEKEVPYEEIVRGFEVSKGEYVVLTAHDFECANVKKTSSLEIIHFAREREIESVYFEKFYFVEPDERSVKPYALLRATLEETKKVGIARFVLRNRERIGILKPWNKMLLLNQLRFASEIKDPKGLRLPSGAVSGKELEIAKDLVAKMTKMFAPEDYKDTYTKELRAIIKEKAAGKRPTPRGEEPKPTNVTDLMAALKASLAEKPAGTKK
jgi:DNA end-binding protein Ku